MAKKQTPKSAPKTNKGKKSKPPKVATGQAWERGEFVKCAKDESK